MGNVPLGDSSDHDQRACRELAAGDVPAHETAVGDLAAAVRALEARKALLAGTVAALTAPDDRAAGLFEVVIADAQLWPFDLTRVHLLFGERLRRSRKVTRSRHRAAAELAATAPTRQRETGPQEPLTA